MANRAAAIFAKAARSLKSDQALSDRDLLTRYAESDDQAAFAAVVSRHTAMVQGVCRRLLHSQADAEDACQAVFLILSKKAKSLRWRESVANWLYITARKVAHNARLAQVRRAKRERAGAKPELVSPADTMSGRELVMVLDEELDKLSPRYREPLVLCYLEGLMRDEAAARLGVPEATLKSQLERGRKKLAEALTSRGCTLGVTLLATVATSSAGASPSRLVESILAAVGGSPSKAAAVLVKGIAMNGVLIRAKLMMLAVVGAVAMGFGFSTLLPVAAKPQKASAETTEPAPVKVEVSAEIARPEVQERIIKGKVLGADGKPIVAELYLTWVYNKPEPLGKTREDGTFTVTVQSKVLAGYLVAKADGHGIDFVELWKLTPADVTLKLPKDQLIRGRIVDPQGGAVQGAAVQLCRVHIYPDNSIQQFLDAWKKRTFVTEAVIPSPDERILWSCVPFRAVTDRDGRFELAGAGAERLVSLKVSEAGRAETEALVVARAGFDARPYNDVTLGLRSPLGSEKQSWSRSEMLSAPDFTLAVEGEKLIRGRLTDAKTGLPRAGVNVQLRQNGLSQIFLKATTDADGKYEIHGAKKWDNYPLEIAADPTNGYLDYRVAAKDTVGYEPVVADFACPKGVIIKGTIRDNSTGKPIAGSIKIAVPFKANNPYLKNYPMFTGFLTPVDTKPDGAFRVVTIPGPILLVGGTNEYGLHDRFKPARPDPKHADLFTEAGSLFVDLVVGQEARMCCNIAALGNWCKVIDVKETDTELVQDIELEPASKKAVRVVDDKGNPLKGVCATGINPRGDFAESVGDTDTITVLNLEPKQERLVVARHPDRKLVGALVVKEADEDPVLQLGAGGTAKGRVVDSAGKPLAEITVQLYHFAEDNGSLSRHRQAVTDVDGKFEFDMLIPGYEFRFLFSKGKKELAPDLGEAPSHTIGKHGETKDLGDLKTDPRVARRGE
jgi:RNA polymerase sigma factor (sigma-70 family)